MAPIGHEVLEGTIRGLDPMIFVTVGTERFDALIEQVDDLVASGVIAGDVFAQIGVGRYLPKHIEFARFVRDMHERLLAADATVTHAGVGSTMELIELGRPFVAVVDPLKINNHQLEYAEALAERFDYCWINGPGRLAEALSEVHPALRLGGPGVEDLARELTSRLSS